METKNKLLISIITCTLNSEDFLKQCLDSVTIQTYKGFEHIIVDGGSTDNTIQIIDKYLRKHKNTRLVVRKAKGISDAMNTGVKNAKGNYVFFLHSDDSLFSEDTLASVAKSLLKKRPNMLVGKILQISKKGHERGTFPSPFWFSLPKFFLKFVNFIPHQAVFLETKILRDYNGFDTSLKYCMDYDLWLKIYPRITTLFKDQIVSNYRVHEGSLSSSSKNRSKVEAEGKAVQRIHTPRTLWPLIYLSGLVTKIYVYLKKVQ